MKPVYEIWYPDQDEPQYKSSISKLSGLPAGTQIYKLYTNAHGEPVEEVIPIIKGKPDIKRKREKHD